MISRGTKGAPLLHLLFILGGADIAFQIALIGIFAFVLDVALLAETSNPPLIPTHPLIYLEKFSSPPPPLIRDLRAH